ncbi:MAG: aldehyde dehydrogenase family protein [bacterium]|nr:aldehyde dehydrogenase family protein [bacterium]
MERADYANLKVTEADHAEIDEAIRAVLWGAKTGPQKPGCLEDRNPANPNAVIARWPQSVSGWRYVSELFVSAAVAQQTWRGVPFRERIAVMRQWAANIEAQLAKFIALMMVEAGKTRGEAKAEACEAVDLIRYYCNLYEEAGGYTVTLKTSVGAKANTMVMRPMGVFAVIAPFNFPMALSVGMCTGALLTGNAVVFKPSLDAPLTGTRLHQAFIDACEHMNNVSLGRDVFACVIASDRDFECGMRESRGYISGLAFTGSKKVGSHLKWALDHSEPAPKIVAELGGKNSCIVTPSASSLEAMGRGVARSAFSYSGQKCSACSVLIVHESLKEKTIASVVKAAEEEFVMGDPREHDVTLGPLINERAYGRYLGVRDELMKSGADVIVPVIRKKSHAPGGYFAEPVIVSGLPANHRLHYEELFMPVLCVRTYARGIREAVEIANSTEYGLTAGLFSFDSGEVAHFLENIDAGVLYVNREAGATTGAWPGEQPFAGWKNSGIVSQFGVCGPNYLLNFVRGQSRTIYA